MFLPQDPDPQFHSLVLWGKKKTLSQFIWLAFCTILQVERLPFPFCQDTKLTFWSTHCHRWERDVGHPLQEKHGMELFYRWLFFLNIFLFLFTPDFFFWHAPIWFLFFHSRVGKNLQIYHERPTKIQRFTINMPWYTTHLSWFTTNLLCFATHLLLICLGVCRFCGGRIRFLNAHLSQTMTGSIVTKSSPSSPWFPWGMAFGGSKTLRFSILGGS